MPLITAAQKANLHSPHHTMLYASALVPETLWSAEINDPTIEIGATDIAFNSGSGLSFGMVRVSSEVWIGTSAGDDDIGRGRVRATSTGDGGVTGSINIAPNSFQFVDGLYLTFKFDFPIKPTYSYVDPSTETFNKDYDQPYTDQNSFPPPVTIAGPHRGGYIDDTLGYLEIPVNLVNSYPMTDGATIASYAMEVLAIPGNSYTTSFDTGTGLGYIRFEDPGNYWVKFTSTDSNGRGQQTWRWYRAHSTDPTSAHYPLVNFALSLTGNWDSGGLQAGINAHDGFALDELPERALVVIWQDVEWGDPGTPMNRLQEQAPNIFTGYVVGADDTINLDEGIENCDFALTTPEGRLRSLYGFSLTLRATNQTVDDWYLFEEWMTTGHAVHHLLRWHTTLLEVCDVIGLDIHPYLRVGAMVQDGNIYAMAESLLWEQGVRAHLVSNPGGQLRVSNEPQLLRDSERSALNEVMEIEKDDRSGPVTIHRRQTRIAPFATVSGIYWDGTFEDGDETKPNVLDVCAQGPGAFAADDGPDPAALDNQLWDATGQAHANAIAGRLFFATNNPFPAIDVHFPGNYLSILDVTRGEYYTMDFQVPDTPSGALVGTKNMYLREYTAEYDVDGGVMAVSATLELDAPGHDGTATECPGLPELGGFPDPPPIEIDLGGGLMTAASVNVKSPLGDSWSQVVAEATNSLIADPYWPTRQGTESYASAITWRCGLGYIKWSDDNWSTENDVTPAGPIDGVAVASIEFVEVAAGVTQGEFVVIGRYDSGSAWTSWLFYTDDDGATWSWSEVNNSSEFIDWNGFFTGSGFPTPPQYGEGMSRVKDNLFLVAGTFSGNDRFSVRLVSIDGNNQETLHDYIEYIDASAYITHFSEYTGPNTGGSCVQALGIDRAFVVFCDVDSIPFVAYAYGIVVDAEAKTLAWSAQGPITLGNWEIHGEMVRGAALNDTSAIIVGSYVTVPPPSIMSVTKAYHFSVDADGYVTWNDGLIIGDAYNNNRERMVVAPLTSTKVAVAISRYLDSGVPYEFTLFTVSWNGSSLSWSLHGTYDTGVDAVLNFDIAAIGNSKILLWYIGFDTIYRHHMQILDGSGAGLAEAGSEYTEAASGSLPGQTILRLVEGNYASGNDLVWAVVGNDNDHVLQIDLDIASSTISGFTNSITRTQPNSTIYANDAMLVSTNPNHFTWIGVQSQYLSFSFLYAPATSGGTKALGMSIDRLTGNSVLITGWDGSNLVVYEYDIVSLLILGNADLGACTEGELNAETYIAYPYIGWDGRLYVYGRMQDPQSLGDPSHVIYYNGASWVAVETSWGADVCGALWVEADGTITAIRNLAATDAKLYRGSAGGGLSLISTLTIPGVNYRAIALDWYTGDVYLGSDESGSIMVVKVQAPYQVANISNLTYDHDTDDPITAVVLL